MEILHWFVDVILHLDQHLAELVQNYGTTTYIILFLIVFCETGLVVTPFLPGDSLLFAIGAISSIGGLDLGLVMLLLCVAAILGDTVNYHIGKYIGPRAFESKNSRIFKREYLERTERFFEKYGGKTIIIARFVPIIRTFAPFLAGVGTMSYRRFLVYNVVGGVFWVGSLTLAGYFFGELEIVKKNFSLVVFAIIFISILPAIIELIKAKRERVAQS